MKKSSIFFMFIVLLSCARHSKGDSGTDDDKDYNMYVKNFFVQNVVSRDTTWTLNGEEGFYYQRKYIFNINSVEINFYENNEKSTLVTSDKGIFYQKSSDMDLMGNVVIKTKDGTQVYSDTISWNGRDQKFLSNDYVKVIYKSGSTLDGHGMEADKDLNKIIFKNNVSGEVVEEDLNSRRK